MRSQRSSVLPKWLGFVLCAFLVSAMYVVPPPLEAKAADTSRFIQSIAPMSQRTQREYAVPASVTIAQAILESGWGESGLSVHGRAYFGIKCFARVSPYQHGCINLASLEYYDPANPVSQVSAFRTYRSAEDSFTDHAYFLRTNSRYAPAFSTTTSDDFIRAVGAAGYATDPNYANLVIGIMRQYNLYQYDAPGAPIPPVSLTAAFASKYAWLGGAGGVLGFPIGGEMAGTPSGSRIWLFNTGLMMYTAQYGAFGLYGPIADRYRASSWVRGNLGPVKSDTYAVGDVIQQDFVSGRMYQARGVAYEVWGSILTTYVWAGEFRGVLGLPTAGTSCTSAGCQQTFEGGVIYSGAQNGGFGVWGDILKEYQRLDGAAGELGNPTGQLTCSGSTCWQDFANGTIYWHPTRGTYAVYGDMRTEYQRVSGPLGFPASVRMCGTAGGGCVQNFEGGTIYWKPGVGAFATYGDIRREYWRLNAWEGPLGFPSGAVTCLAGGAGCVQNYENGTIYWRQGLGAFGVIAEMRGEYWRLKAWEGPLGFPTSVRMCGTAGGGCVQNFEGGTIYWKPGVGAFATYGDIRREYWRLNAWEGPLGNPSGVLTCLSGGEGCVQNFEKGTIYWSPTAGAFGVIGELRTEYWRLNAWEGPLGFPTSIRWCGVAGNACVQNFKGGTIYSRPGLGTHAVMGPIRDEYWRQKAWEGPLGFPKGQQTCAGNPADACEQPFEGGMISWTSAGGATTHLS